MLIGVMGAMPQEVESLVDSMKIETEDDRAMRTWRRGRLFEADVVLVHSLCGKVAAAAAAERYSHSGRGVAPLFRDSYCGDRAVVRILSPPRPPGPVFQSPSS